MRGFVSGGSRSDGRTVVSMFRSFQRFTPKSARCLRPVPAWVLVIPLALGSLSAPLFTVQSAFAGSTSLDDGFTSLGEAKDLQNQVIELIDRTRPAIVGLEISFVGSGRRIGCWWLRYDHRPCQRTHPDLRSRRSGVGAAGQGLPQRRNDASR